MVLVASLARFGNAKRVAQLECPLCRIHYKSIIHDFVLKTKFQLANALRYLVFPAKVANSPGYEIDLGTWIVG